MSPEDTEWLRQAVERSGEKIAASTIFLSLFTEGYAKDPVAVLQLGIAVALDKPIHILAPYGVELPANIRRLARTVSRYDPDDIESLKAATESVVRSLRRAKKG